VFPFSARAPGHVRNPTPNLATELEFGGPATTFKIEGGAPAVCCDESGAYDSSVADGCSRCIVLSALLAGPGALGHTIIYIFRFGKSTFLAHHRAAPRQTLRDSVWSMLQDRSLRNLSLTRGLRLANPSELALPPWATRDLVLE